MSVIDLCAEHLWTATHCMVQQCSEYSLTIDEDCPTQAQGVSRALVHLLH